MQLDRLCRKFETIVEQNSMLEDGCNDKCYVECSNNDNSSSGSKFGDLIKNPWFIGIVIGLLVSWLLLMGCRSCA